MADILRVPPSRFVSPGKLRNLPSKNMYFLRKSNGVTPIELDAVTTKLWYDAEDTDSLTISTGHVDDWTDLSGNAVVVDQIGTARPEYGSRTLNSITIPDGEDIQAYLDNTGLTGTGVDNFHTGGELWVVVDIDSDGEADNGTIYRTDGTPINKGTQLITLNESGSAVDLRFQVGFSGTNGTWDVTTTLGAHLIHVIYDGSSTTNDPTIEVDGVELTIHTETTPVGTISDDAGGNFYIMENNGIRGFDGGLAELAFTGTLTADERTGLTTGLMTKWGLS